MCKSKDSLSPTVKRDLSHRSVQKFIDEMQQIDWQIVTEIRDPQNAYSQFHNIYVKHMINVFHTKSTSVPTSIKSPGLLLPLESQ